MKKKLLVITALLFLLVAGLMISAPFVIESQKVQEQILSRINSLYVVDASVSKIAFTWFPFPHVKMEGIEVRHEDFSATSPQTSLYPSWKILFGLTSLGRLHITDPVFHLHTLPGDKEELKATAISLPAVKLKIKNGTLHLPAHNNAIFASQKILLKNISASLAIHGNKGEFSWESEASFAKSFAFSGEFRPQGRAFVEGGVEELQPQKILTSRDKALLNPIDDLSTLSFRVTKQPERLNIDLQGDIPDISLSRLDKEEEFRVGKGDLSLELGRQNTFSLQINDLVLIDPQFAISGEIARHFPGSNEQANIKIDLKAKDIDLTGVRQKVLGLVGDNAVAQMVTDIVQKGTANSASYFFDAPVKSFEDVTAMTIEVDIAEADIHLGDIPLDLINAQGPILIKDGDLTGTAITTWVGDAKGTNGVFLVGLADDKFGLQVDVDIDANLVELPAVLRTLIDDKDVVHELGMVQGRGRASGHLHIGDDLRDFNVIVDVNRYDNAELRYNRLSWPLRPESGYLQVTDTSLTWSQIKAQIGSHSIQESSGHASWDDPATPLSLRSLHCLVDANTLLAELQQHPVLNKALSGVITSIQGSVEMTGGLDGPFFTPEEYTYSFETKLKDITFKTPVLPGNVVIDKGQGTIDHQKISLLSSSGTLLDQPIRLSGELGHDDWQSWQGNLQLSGILGADHLSWLHDKGIIPQLITPRPPYHVPSISISWDDQTTNTTGKILSADQTTTLNLDIKEENNLFSGGFWVESPADKAVFRLKWDTSKESFTSSFKGKISTPSLHALVDDSNASFATINGDFRVHKTTDSKTKKTALDFNGALLGRDIHWTWGKENRVFTITTANLVAHDSLLKVKELQIDFNNEPLAATGTFSSKPGFGHFELDLTSPSSLTATNIEKFEEDLDHFISSTLPPKKDAEKPSTYEFSGLLNFNLAGLIVPFGTKNNNGDPGYAYQLPFTPLKGNYLFSKTDSALNLQNSEVCGVGVNGQLTWHGPQETSKEISLMTPVEAPLEFKDFLSCFNFDGIIEGPLEISGRIHSDLTLCKRGGLLLSSKKGIIKKFVALAKTLSLINITGLSGAIWNEGFYYNALEVSGNICDNIFTIDKAFIDGDGVDVIATGEINLSTMEYDVTLFVVPFATIHGLVTKVPLVGRVLGGQEGRIVSVPVKVTGPLNDPNVTILSPSAIGEATGKWILETITLPFGWMIPEGALENKENLPNQPAMNPSPASKPVSQQSTGQEQQDLR